MLRLVFSSAFQLSYFGNSHGEECPIPHCSTLRCVFQEYQSEIKWTVTVGGYHIVKEYTATLSECVGSVFI
jgi:hypothetical protein